MKPVGLGRALQLEGICLSSASFDFAGIFLKAVLKFLIRWRLQAVEHSVGFRDFCSVFARQIFGNKSFQENQPAVAVCDGVEKLNRNSAPVQKHAEGAFAYIVKGHVRERIAFFVHNPRRPRHFLKVIPEKPAAQAHGYRGETADRDIKRRLKLVPVDLFF